MDVTCLVVKSIMPQYFALLATWFRKRSADPMMIHMAAR